MQLKSPTFNLCPEAKIKSFAKQQQELTEEIFKFITNKAIPLTLRINCYSETGKYFPVVRYISDWPLTSRSCPEHLNHLSYVEYRRGFVSGSDWVNSLYEELHMGMTEEVFKSYNCDPTLDEIRKHSELSPEAFDINVQRIELILASGSSGLGLDW